MNETTHRKEHNLLSALYLAFELGNKKWRLGFTVGLGQRPRERTIAAGDLVAFQEEIRLAKKRFDLAQTAGVMSCYEAGRDGFWLHRYLLSKDIKAMLTVLVEAERCAVWGYTQICNMTAGKDHRTYDLALAILNEEIQHESWFSEFLGEGPSGHFMRRGENSPYPK